MKISGLASLNSRSASDFSRKSYSRLCGVLIDAHPAARNFSTTNEPRNPFPPLSTTRRFSQNPIPPTSVLRRLSLDRFHHAGHRILPVVPVAELLFQNRASSSFRLAACGFHVRIHHDCHQLLESHARLPS